jgi:hypothetical protein
MNNDFDFDTGPRRRSTCANGWGEELLKAVTFMVVGAAVAYGIAVATGHDLADRKSVKAARELEAWAANPEVQRRMKEATEDMRAAAKKLSEFDAAMGAMKNSNHK